MNQNTENFRLDPTDDLQSVDEERKLAGPDDCLKVTDDQDGQALHAPVPTSAESIARRGNRPNLRSGRFSPIAGRQQIL